MYIFNNVFLSTVTLALFAISQWEHLLGSSLLSESLSHMSFHFFLLFIFFTLLCVIRKYWVPFALSGMATVYLSFQILPYYLTRIDDINIKDGPPLQLLMLNVNRQTGSPNKLIQLVNKHNPEIVFLMEVSPRWQESIEEIAESYTHQEIILRQDNFGMALLSKVPWKAIKSLSYGPKKVPSLVTEFVVEETKVFNLVFTHPPPPINQEFYEQRNEQLLQVSRALNGLSEPKMLFGDLNITAWTRRFEKFKTDLKLKDCRKGFGLRPTWPAQTYPVQIAIDQCLYSKGVQIVDIKTLENIGSDHLPVLTQFVIQD